MSLLSRKTPTIKTVYDQAHLLLFVAYTTQAIAVGFLGLNAPSHHHL